MRNILFKAFIISSFASGIKIALNFKNQDLNLNFTQIIFLIIVALSVISFSFWSKKFKAIESFPSFFLLSYFAINLISSLTSSESKSSLKGCFVIFLYFSIYLLGRYIIQNYLSIRDVINDLFLYNLISVFFGLVSVIYSIILKPDHALGVVTGHLETGVPSIRSFSFEPNLFAILTATIFCLYISLYVYGFKQYSNKYLICLILLSVIFAYTRSVYFSLPLAIILILILSGRVPLTKIVFSTSLLVVFTFILIYFLGGDNIILNSIFNRVGNIANVKEGSALGRILAYDIGIKGFFQSPIIGNGTLSANTLVFNDSSLEYQELEGSPGWLTSFFIQSLHDTGIIGFFISFSLLSSIIYANYTAFKRENVDLFRKALLLGFLGGNIVIAICTQISSIMWVSYTYIYWAVNMSLLYNRFTVTSIMSNSISSKANIGNQVNEGLSKQLVS